MRYVTLPLARTKAPQNSLVGRCGVSRGLGLPSRTEGLCTGGLRQVQWGRVIPLYKWVRGCCKQVRGQMSTLIPTDSPVLMLMEGRGKWHLPVPLFMEESLCECCLSKKGSKMSKWGTHSVPQALFRSLFPGLYQ